MDRQIIVGLTGPTGAGKTTVSSILAQNGYSVIDADIVARQVVEPNKPCLGKLVEAFGDTILSVDGTLNRRALGLIAFPSRERLDKLNGIIYPYIIDEIKLLIKQNRNEGHRVTILDAPTLFESGCDKICDKIVVVTAPLGARLMRIISRDNLSYDQAMQRIASQKSEEFFVSHADYLMNNDNKEVDYTSLLNWLRQLEDLY